MDAQKAVYKLCDHFLGKDWYIVDPVSIDVANDIIVEQICARYNGIDEDPVDTYRRRHKKCKWCKHCVTSHALDKVGQVHIKYKCSAKDEYVNENFPHMFCKMFLLSK